MDIKVDNEFDIVIGDVVSGREEFEQRLRISIKSILEQIIASGTASPNNIGSIIKSELEEFVQASDGIEKIEDFEVEMINGTSTSVKVIYSRGDVSEIEVEL